MKVAFFGTPGFAVPSLERLVGNGHEVVLVVTQPDVLEWPRASGAEVAIVAAYGEVLRADLLAVPARGFLNVHPSLLPRLRGATPVPSAILEGATATGVTVMGVTTGVDSGPI